MEDGRVDAGVADNLETQPVTADCIQVSNVLRQDGTFLSVVRSNVARNNIRDGTRGSTENSTYTESLDDGIENITVTPIRLSETLKRHLEADYDNVVKKRRLTKVPAEPNSITVLEDFVRHYAAARMVSYEKQRSKVFYTSNRREEDKLCYEKALDSINIAKEVAEGVRILLDFNLERLLFYEETGEEEQYNRYVLGTDSRDDALKAKGIKHAAEYNQKATCLEKDQAMETNSDERLVDECNENQIPEENEEHNVENSENIPKLLSMTALRERRKVSLSIDSKKTSTADTSLINQATVLPSGACSSKDSTTSGRSSATPTPSLLTPPATSPTTPQANQLLRTLQEWRLVPPNLTQTTEESCMPSLMYGPIYLLRLFVKMPEILGRMKIPQKTSKVIVKYMDSLLEYLESQPSLFNNEAVYE